jgi:hypothetical protein
MNVERRKTNMAFSDDFNVVMNYSQKEDKISIENDRPLTKGDIVLLLSNLLSLLETNEREFASKIALEAVNVKKSTGTLNG